MSRRLARNSYPVEDVARGVDIFRIVYETVDPSGLAITASGALIVPENGEQREEALPLMSWQHGTEIYKGTPPLPSDSFPSEIDSYYHELGMFHASSGYVTVMPDYIGLGASPGLHPYLHADTEASAVIDMLRAVRTFCEASDIRLNSELFLAGYSQGGHATAAAHREIERNHAAEFAVTASAPMAGPYDMSGSLRHLLDHPDYPRPVAFAYVLAAWMPVYELAETLDDLFAEEYAKGLVTRFDGGSAYSAIDAAMAPDVRSALDPSFLDAILTNPDHAFWRAAAKNDVLDWAPVAPIRLIHCAGDEEVPFANTETAKAAWKANGADSVEVVDPTTSGVWSHRQGYRPGIIAAKRWFDGMRK